LRRPIVQLLALMLLLAPASARAQAPVPQIDGSPLNVWTTGQGQVQVALDGAPGEFYSPGSADAPGTTPNAGFSLVFSPGPNSIAYGPFAGGGYPDPVSGPTVQPGNPATITTTWQLTGPAGPVQLTQLLSYTNGSRDLKATYTVTNTSDGTITFRALWAADLAIRGSDSGVGFQLGNAPTRFIGGLNQDVGAAGGFVEDTPWSAFMSGPLGDVATHARADDQNPGFDNSISAEPVDNAAGVEWDDHYSAPLAQGQSAVYSVGLRFIDTLGITPLGATHLTGDEHVVNAHLAGLDGQPQAGTRLVWTAAGANAAAGTATTDRNGNASFSYIGGNEGEDNLLVYADQNRNGQKDTTEPQASTIVTWNGGGLSAPVIGQSVNVRPEKGTVKVQLARGTSKAAAKRLGFPAIARKRFVPLRAGLQIPVGSLLDTQRGTVRLLSAGLPTPTSTGFQGASFSGSRFQVRQAGNNPLTSLIAKDSLGKCNTKVPRGGARKVVVARKRSRTLFGSGKGRFRTRGRNSSATVRGTTWVQKDTCTTTTTLVKSGTVVVHDFAKRRNITIKSTGKRKRYVARAPRRR
jgi:hypothetical protein